MIFNSIRGVYIVRGADAQSAFDVAPDWESYNLTPLNWEKPEDRKLVEEVWKWEDVWNGKECADGVSSIPFDSRFDVLNQIERAENFQINFYNVRCNVNLRRLRHFALLLMSLPLPALFRRSVHTCAVR